MKPLKDRKNNRLRSFLKWGCVGVLVVVVGVLGLFIKVHLAFKGGFPSLHSDIDLGEGITVRIWSVYLADPDGTSTYYSLERNGVEVVPLTMMEDVNFDYPIFNRRLRFEDESIVGLQLGWEVHSLNKFEMHEGGSVIIDKVTHSVWPGQAADSAPKPVAYGEWTRTL